VGLGGVYSGPGLKGDIGVSPFTSIEVVMGIHTPVTWSAVVSLARCLYGGVESGRD
jgi:hypothetical protein